MILARFRGAGDEPRSRLVGHPHLDRFRDRELIFCNWRGRPLDGGALTRRFKAARDGAGLRPLRFHDLRHTYGSLLAQGGVDVLSIKESMGHSDLATTQRYLHARQASEQVEAPELQQ